MLQKLISFTFVGIFYCLSLTNSSLAFQGAGTPDDPYLIFTAQDLNAVGADASYWSQHFRLAADINMSVFVGTEYNVIGNRAAPFTGTFDGNGYTITNLTYVTTSAIHYVGLFGYTDNADIKNVALENVNISTGGGCAGGLVGYQTSGTIVDCHSSGTVTSSATYVYYLPFPCAGGLVGFQSSGAVAACYSTASVCCFAHSFGGGLVGLQDGGTIANCYSAGSVHSTSYPSSLVLGFGGLVGQSNGIITDCYSTASVSASHSATTVTDTTAFAAGGLVGDLIYGTIMNCYCTGSVSSASYGHSWAGGLVGILSDGTIVMNCHSTGSVTSACFRHSGCDSVAGGLVGSDSGTIMNCYSTGEVSSRNSSTVASSHAGGLVGALELYGSSAKTIDKCYSSGQVSATANSLSVWKGGLIGYMYGSTTPYTVTACFWDTETSGLTTSRGGAGVQGKTTAEMQNIATYLQDGWDFLGETLNGTEDIWAMLPGSYPIHSYVHVFSLNTGQIDITEGQMVNFEVVLPFAPPEEVEVNLAVAGDRDFVLLTASRLLFDANNWDKPQTTTIRANLDDNYLNDEAVLRAYSNMYAVEVPIREVDIQPEPPHEVIVVNADKITVQENSEASFAVTLAEDPLGVVNVDVAIGNGDDIELLSSETLFFDSSNYIVPHTVTIHSGCDWDENNSQAVISLTSPNLRDSLGRNVIIYVEDTGICEREISGQLPSGETVWPANSRLVLNNVSVPTDGKLIVEAGVMLKLSGTSNYLTVNGEIEIRGSTAEPVIITSAGDDPLLHWGGIRVTQTGKASIENAEIRYAVTAIDGNYEGSQIRLRNCLIRNSSQYGIYVYSPLVEVMAENVVIANSGLTGIFMRASSRGTFRNCTIVGNATGIHVGAATMDFENCIVAFSASGIDHSGADESQTTVSHSLFYNPGGQDIVWTAGGARPDLSQNGNIIADPLFVNRAAGNYELDAGSPAIDSGYGQSSVLTDLLGRSRYDDKGMPNVGRGINWITDMGAYERQGDTERSDLAITYVSRPSPCVVEPNDVFSVSWTIANEGDLAYTSGWQEKVYLSDDQYLSPQDRLLEILTYAGPFDPNEHGYCSMTMNVPLDVSGLKYVIVRLIPSNLSKDINQQNNVACSFSPIAVNLPCFDVGHPVTGTIQPGQWKYYRYSATDLRTVRFAVETDTAGGALLYGAYENVPSVSQYDFRADVPNNLVQTVAVSAPLAGDYYIGVCGKAAVAFTLSAEYADLAIMHVDPQTIGNTGSATIEVDGTSFNPDYRLTLIQGATECVQGDVYYETHERLYVTFDLASNPMNEGVYSVRISDPNTTDSFTLADSVQVVLDGGPDFWADVQLPGISRPGRTIDIQLTYGNRGTVDMHSPMLILSSSSESEWQLPGSDTWQSGAEVRMLALSSSGPADILRPGQAETVTVKYRVPLTGSDVRVSLSSLGAREGDGGEQVIDWTAIFGEGDLAHNAGIVFGTTWQEYICSLSKMAAIDKIFTGSTTYGVAGLEGELYSYSWEDQVPDWDEVLTEVHGTSLDTSEPGSLYIRIDNTWWPATADRVWPGTKTVVIFHGLANDYREDWIALMADAIKVREPGANVMAVDWGGYANWLGKLSPALFVLAATHIPEVAGKVRENLRELGLDDTASMMHFIGHSHGAHVAGLTAKYLGRLIERLTALDASEEWSHFASPGNWFGTGWDKYVAAYTDFYKSSQIMGAERDYGNHNFLLVKDGCTWGDASRELLATSHGFSHEWFTGTIIPDGDLGYNWGWSKWQDVKDDISSLSAQDGPWLGLIRGNDIGGAAIELLSLAADNTMYANTWYYPGAWQKASLSLQSLERAVELVPHTLYVESLEVDGRLKYGGRGLLTYLTTNNADNTSIDYDKREAAQMGGRTGFLGPDRVPVKDCIWLSKDATLDPLADYRLEIVDHSCVVDPHNALLRPYQVPLGAQGEGNCTQPFEVGLVFPGREELESRFGNTTNDEYYIFVDAGSTRLEQFRYAEELYPSNNISPPLHIVLEDEALSADAGGPYVVVDTDGDGTEVVWLDGSGSAPAERIVSYQWSIGASGITTSHVFPVGENPVALTVTNQEGDSDTAEALVIVKRQHRIPDGHPEGWGDTGVYTSYTPEDKIGPSGTDGVSASRCVSDSERLTYRIEFWNKEDANVPTQDAVVEDTLDSSVFDISTVELTRVGFLRWDKSLPGGQSIDTRIDCRPDMDIVVDVTAELVLETGRIRWWFHCVDPATGDWPEDPMAGFLPPFNPDTGYEIGWVEFSVKLKEGLPTGTQVANRAYVEFDFAGDLYDHPAPKEAPWTNTIDAGKPTSSVNPLPAQSSLQFTLSWQGQDDDGGSDVAAYDIYVSEDGSPFRLWTTTAATSATFTGLPNRQYQFCSIARDRVGHHEDKAPLAEAMTCAIPDRVEIESWNLINKTRVGRTVFDYEISVTVRNNGSSSIYNLSLELVRMPPELMLLDSTILISSVSPGDSVASTDLFKIRIDRTQTLSDLETICRMSFNNANQSEQWSDYEGTIEFSTDSVSYATRAVYLVGDVTNSGSVNITDLAQICSCWLSDCPSVDIAPTHQGDGIIDFLDFAELSRNWRRQIK